MKANGLDLLALGGLFFVSGCLSSALQAPTTWYLESSLQPTLEKRDAAALPAAKVMAVNVRAPYNGRELAVLRPDGSVAFDSFNLFAVQPSLMLTGVVIDTLERSGRFSVVSDASALPPAEILFDFTVTRLALDCCKPDRPQGEVSLLVMCRGRDGKFRFVRTTGRAENTGDYTAVFSKATTEAVLAALRELDVK